LEGFRTFKRGVEGHLFQVGDGYLLSENFQYYYQLDPYACQRPETFFCTDPIWEFHEQSCHQIKHDKEFFYGLLVTATRNISNKTIMEHGRDLDGITAWMELRKDFDYDGSAKFKLEELEEFMYSNYSGTHPQGLAGYIDAFMSTITEMEIIQMEDLKDELKKRILLKNIRGLPGINYLVQTCIDHETWTYKATCAYLRENS